MVGRRWLEMTWRDGLFLHWPVDPSVVAETLPDGLAVATHDGDAYLGVVPFVMESIRPRGSPIGRSFPELNLRTYVTGPAGPGVYFYSLDAADAVGVGIARRLFSLPYYRAQMRVDRDGDAVTITSDRTHGDAGRATFDATYEPTGDSFTPVSGSLPAFLLENYRFYTAGRRLYRGEIAHEPWTLRPATATVRTNSLFEANGFDVPSGEPVAHYAEPIEVTADRRSPPACRRERRHETPESAVRSAGSYIGPRLTSSHATRTRIRGASMTTQRLHPRVRVVWILRAVLVAVVLSAPVGGAAYLEFLPSWAPIAVGGVLLTLGTGHAIARYRRWRYEIREDALYLDRGVITQVRTTVPLVRIQHVDSRRGPVERTAGLASCVVYTAGSRGADVRIPGLTPAGASDLREELKRLAIRAEGEDAV